MDSGFLAEAPRALGRGSERRTGMHPVLYSVKAAAAMVVSSSMAALGCLMGCMQPAASGSGRASDTPASWNISSDAGHSMPMAEAENCHQSGGNSPASPADRKPASNGPLSCCPLEVTVIQKWDTTEPRIAPPRDFAPSSHFSSVLARLFVLPEYSQPLGHNGRDTLLETQLLRI